jgi:glucose/arabinose dehydrogenase
MRARSGLLFLIVLLTGCGDSGKSVAPVVDGLTAPPGFAVSIFASGVGGARMFAVGPDGDVYLSLTGDGKVVRLPDRDHDGRADSVETVVSGLDQPHGLAFLGRRLYIAENPRVIRVSIPAAGGPGESLTVVVPDLPSGGGHSTRSLAIDPAGAHLFVSAGSSCNVCAETDPRRAAVSRYDIDGSNFVLYARGLRNAVGLAFRPGTGELWATDNGRDELGDNLPPEEIVDILQEGGDYGWPDCYGDRVLDPTLGGDSGRCAGTIPPALTDTAHVAPLGCAFYTGDAFPPDYRGDFFVACHGSWNRSIPVGYKVLRVHVENGRPVRAETFLGGFRLNGIVRGRPAGVCAAPDGALLVSDDMAGNVYRVVHARSAR